MNDMPSSERWIIGFLLAVAMLTFFFPLASLQLPVFGNQEMSGYDLIAKGKEFYQALDSVKSKELSAQSSEESQPESGDSKAASHSPIPLSVQALPLIPVEIFISFGCALIALFCCLGPFGSAPAKAFSTLGAVAAVAALLHLTIANSDLHTWFREQMKADSSALANNPFAGLAQQIASLAINSVQIKPGVGLYVLALTLSLATIILLSKVLSVSPSLEVLDPHTDQSDTHARTLAFFVLLSAAAVFVVIVLLHKPQTSKSMQDSVQPPPSSSKESDIFRWPTHGLPTAIANALNTPDLATGKDAGTKLMLGTSGQRQIVSVATDPSYCGSGGCSWDLIEENTKLNLIEGEQGALHKTESITDGYYDLLVEGKYTLSLYKFNGVIYQQAQCYSRSDGQLGSPAKLTPCTAVVGPVTTPNAGVGYPVPEETFVDAYVLANAGRDDLSKDQLVQLGHDEYKMGLQINTQTLLVGGSALNTRGKRAMDYLDKLYRQQHQTQ